MGFTQAKTLGNTSVPTIPYSNGALRYIQQGLGAILNGQTQTGDLWSPEKATHHINYLELLAAFLAIKAFGKTWQSVTMLLRIDKITAVCYINQKGGTTSKLLCQLAISIWTWCSKRKISLLAEHVRYQLNATSRVRVTSLAGTNDLTRKCE